jgi:glycosyltransferase involved in cell wall biosynthesis
LKLLVIVPALNEGPTVGAVVANLRRCGYDVLVVDDGSSDETAMRAKEAGGRVLPLAFNLGVGGALRAGFKFAVLNGYDAVVQVDADGQHPVDQIRDLVAVAESSNVHMVIGSRFASGAASFEPSRIRRIVMRVLANSASRACSCRLTDATSGFRLIRQPLLGAFAQRFAANYLGDTFEAVVAAGRAGYRVCEIPADLRERQTGVSSASTRQATLFSLKAAMVAVLHLHPRLPRAVDH